MTVTFYMHYDYDDAVEPVCTLSLVDGKIIASGDAEDYLEPIPGFYALRDRPIHADLEPELFMKTLPYRFNGSYVWAEFKDDDNAEAKVG